MRKVIMLMHESLDGFVQGAHDWDINWISFTDELGQYSKDILGSGLPIFNNLTDRIKLKLVANRTFQSGVAGLVYQLED